MPCVALRVPCAVLDALMPPLPLGSALGSAAGLCPAWLALTSLQAMAVPFFRRQTLAGPPRYHVSLSAFLRRLVIQLKPWSEHTDADPNKVSATRCGDLGE